MIWNTEHAELYTDHQWVLVCCYNNYYCYNNNPHGVSATELRCGSCRLNIIGGQGTQAPC